MQNTKSPNSPWKLFIDTGGTFTDCMAVDSDGGEHRCKVLSSSALRGKVSPGKSSGGVVITIAEDLPNDFFKGFEFLFLDDPESVFEVTGFDSESSLLKLNREPEFNNREDHPFELRSPEEAPILGARILTKTPMGREFPPMQMRLSTTKGTNALLEHSGAKTLFLITEGYGDLLRIKNQQRPDLFALDIQKSEPFYHRVIEVPERISSDGEIIKPLDKKLLKERIKPHLKGAEAAGICLMNGYRYDVHERQVMEVLQELGVNYISRSAELSPEIKIVPRAVTTDVNAYLTPIMENYLSRISDVIRGHSLRVMSSGGNLVEAEHYRPKDGLLSGPAGGVIGAAAIAKHVPVPTLQGFGTLGGLEKTGFSKIISFDMGGTSSDVARYDGSIDYVYEHSVGDATLTTPAVEIETVAAGGGSICEYDGRSLTVGPESAGADPGPACYGRGGPLTITDVNLLSGRLHPENFHISIVPEKAEERLDEILGRISGAEHGDDDGGFAAKQRNQGKAGAELLSESGHAAEQPDQDSEQRYQNRNQNMSREQVLEGFLEIANERMAQTIRKISIQKGFDPSEYAMVAFGGAGAQHALAIAEKLKISRVLVPSDAGLLSAYGLRMARLEQITSKQILRPLHAVQDQLVEWFDEITDEGKNLLSQQGIEQDDIELSRKNLFLRLKGQDSSLEIEFMESKRIEDTFKKAYEDQYGHWIENREIEVEAVRVKVSEKKDLQSLQNPGGLDKGDESKSEKDSEIDELPILRQKKHSSEFYSREKSSPFQKIYLKQDFKPGSKLTGPALILDPHSTTVVEEGWEGQLLGDGTWLFQTLQGLGTLGGLNEPDQRSEAVNLQLYTNRFRSVADQMGEMLRKTSMSVNVKERLDFSCALLDADGYLVVNAPHIPVHLGAMGTCVRTLLEETLQGVRPLGGLGQDFGEGDIIVTNHPGFGGSHLPDVTVVTPVFYEGERIGFVASRAHHAEMGGKRPGSMPPDANNLAEEGVVIPPMFIAKGGEFDWKPIKQLLQNSRWPTRSIDENMADLQAAVSANHRGVKELQKLAGEFGASEVTDYMGKLKEYASSRMRSTLKKISDGEYKAEEKLDDGSLLAVSCRVDDESVRIDFTGTSGVHPGNLNANPSIVNSVVMYVLRLMVDESLPLNDGLLEPVELIIPYGMLNPEFPDDPADCPAVVGGNIETSQRLVDTLLKAFNLSACSYGTMNNVLFGNDTFGYYETVAGGTGAGDRFHGADAVHQHMTNTRATDPEILEHRYPVRLDRYAIREKSGGRGKWNGGNGLIREMTFLEPVSLSVLSQHRVVEPYGLNGGKNGKTGKQWIERKDGSKHELTWRDGADLEKDDRFILHTPGGGGFGDSE
ncbi:5-oxoprolinase [Rhodohalobacter sp. SW132]|uniref:hydantoinase B/oxoprolinase family protein n=1 Tax=Rhodohalobacter sp. SW132 TaxID=2293433 RepID=UPI000E234E83|nr:hydantoinase B/oxoprolinase family protein [Rhodohalobacter sp. SW132]REL33453.1 5-oxoprolinase [Rhodohalobacter sp. SW132]